MNPLKEVFLSGQTIPWIETQNAVAFLRPVRNIVLWTPRPASCLAEFLRLGKISLALTQLLLTREQAAVRKHARQSISQTLGGLLEQSQLGGSPRPRSGALHREHVWPVDPGTDRDREHRRDAEPLVSRRREDGVDHRPGMLQTPSKEF